MKKMVIVILLFFIPVISGAPPLRVFYIEQHESISSYDPLIRAVVQVESMGNIFALNIKEQAVGAFQIRQCRIEHYNRLQGTNYLLEDCFDYALSKRVFLFFAEGKTWEKAAKSWNGSGPMTKKYWEKVKKNLLVVK
jgi:hypothetical protein